jgi:hypothetical protein
MPQSTQHNPPPPPPPPPPASPPIGVAGTEVGTQPVVLLAGLWVTSFTGWQLLNPHPEPDGLSPAEFREDLKDLPPFIGGYGWIPPQPYDPEEFGGHYPKEGYFICSALVRLALDGRGLVTGVMEFIRGGRGYQRRRIIEGSYTIRAAADLPGTYEGTITETHETSNPDAPTTFTYAYVMRDANTLDWIWREGSYRPMVASGTFNRIWAPFR